MEGFINMKKAFFKTMVAAMVITLSAGIFAGCGSSDTSTSKSGNSSSKNISGSILADGSTALLPLAQDAASKFQEKYPNATINTQGGGSGTGLKDVAAGNSQIGMSDVFAEEKLPADQASQLVDHKVCVVGFAAVVNKGVTVDNLTKQQLIDIFTGKITNWKDVGGSDMKIVILNRPSSSGTRATFKKYALDGKDEAQGQALQEDSSGAVAKAVQTTPGSISYLASSYVFDKTKIADLKVLKFDSIEMTKDNIATGKYTIWSYEHMYTKGEATGVAKEFINYLLGNDAKDSIKNLGYISMSDMKTKR